MTACAHRTRASRTGDLREGADRPAGLAASLADAARFRNLLVHRYADIDDQRVVQFVRQRLADLEDYVEVIAARLVDGP
jgi:uncharacterized protein YutE (UPF0331/DUF86 family)